VVKATRRKVEGMVEGWRERLASVAGEDMLPLSFFFEGEEEEEEEGGQEREEGGGRKRRREGGKEGGEGRQVRVVVCVEVEDKEEGCTGGKEEEEEEEDEGGEEEEHDLRARERGSLHARRGLSAAAGWLYEGGREGGKEGGLPHAQAPLPAEAMVFVRSPLACLVVLREGGREGWVSMLLHRGFPLDVSSAATAAAVTIRVEVPVLLRGVVERLANMLPPSGCKSSSSSSRNVKEMIDEVMMGRRKKEEEGGRAGGREGTTKEEEEEEEEEYEVEVLVRKLVGILTYHGYLRPCKGEGEREKRKDEGDERA